MKIGDKFRFAYTDYTIVAIFEDEGDTFYVAKCKSSRRANDITVYSNIFTYDYSGRLYKRA